MLRRSLLRGLLATPFIKLGFRGGDPWLHVYNPTKMWKWYEVPPSVLASLGLSRDFLREVVALFRMRAPGSTAYVGWNKDGSVAYQFLGWGKK